MRQLKQKKILVTGGNRGLGKYVLSELSKKSDTTDYILYSTARDKINLETVLKNDKINSYCYQFNLMTTEPKDLKYLIQDDIQPDVIVHCASPYSLAPFSKTSYEEIGQYANCLHNDHVLARSFLELCQKQNKTGTIIFTGAVIGMPECNNRGLIGMLKNNMRALANVCDHEGSAMTSPVYSRYLNLGSFRDEVAEEDSKKFMTTASVAEVICDMIEFPANYEWSFNLVSTTDEEQYHVKNSIRPNQSSYKLGSTV